MKMRNLVFLCSHSPNKQGDALKSLSTKPDLEPTSKPGKKENKQRKNYSYIPQYAPMIANRQDIKIMKTGEREETRRELRSCKQDLGSDGERFSSSESSPSGTPKLSPSKRAGCRRVSAPPNLNYELLETLDTKTYADDLNRTSYRRFSSVDERFVKNHLDNPLKGEAESCNGNFDSRNYGSSLCNLIEHDSTSTHMQRKLSSPTFTSLQNERKVSLTIDNGRPRKKSLCNEPSTQLNEFTPSSNADQTLKEGRKILNKQNFDKIKLKNKEQKYDSRKLSLQDYSSLNKYVSMDEKPKEVSRKFSLQIPNKKLLERKSSMADSKSIFNKYSDRKVSNSEYPCPETKQENRPIHIDESSRLAANGKKKKNERKFSQELANDENNNSGDNKKTPWKLIKNKMKKERKTSNEIRKSSNPQIISRNGSNSSIDSLAARRNRQSDFPDKQNNMLGDQDSISSTNSSEIDDADISDIVGECAFDMWCEGKASLNMESPSLPLLHVAAAKGNTDLLKTLIEVGVDVNELDHNGWPAIHYAICSGHFLCAQLLLSQGAFLENYSNRVMNTYCTSVRNCLQMSQRK